MNEHIESLQLLQDVMKIQSVNSQDDEGQLAEWICEYFNGYGIKAQVDRIDLKHANVYAFIEGEEPSETVLWNGHLDTVPFGELDEWNTDPSIPVLTDAYIFGRGASDMKSGLCAMIYALSSSRYKGVRPRHSILFLGTCDEEKNGIGAREAQKLILEKKINQIIIGEPTGLKIGVAQKGCLWLSVDVHGRTSHGAYPERGCSAVEHGYVVTQKLREYLADFSHPLLGKSTEVITKITGGVAPNMMPDRCVFSMDIRFTPDITSKQIIQKFNKIIQDEMLQCGGMLSIRYSVCNQRSAIEVNESHPLLNQFVEILEEEKIKPEKIGIHFFTDGSIFTEANPNANILLFGPGEPSMAHRANERLLIENYYKAIHVFQKMVRI